MAQQYNFQQNSGSQRRTDYSSSNPPSEQKNTPRYSSVGAGSSQRPGMQSNRQAAGQYALAPDTSGLGQQQNSYQGNKDSYSRPRQSQTNIYQGPGPGSYQQHTSQPQYGQFQEQTSCRPNRPAFRPLEPTRSILITGFKDSAEHKDFVENNVDESQVAEYYALPKSAHLIIVFYDVRESSKLVDGWSHPGLQAQYSISKYEVQRDVECTERNLQGSIYLMFKGLDAPVDDVFITGLLTTYGSVRDVRNSRPFSKIIEFFDIRSARKALRALNGSVFGTGSVRCRYVWDISNYHKTEYIRKIDELLRGSAGQTGYGPSRRPRRRLPEHRRLSNPLLGLFDRYIATHIDDIERAFASGR